MSQKIFFVIVVLMDAVLAIAFFWLLGIAVTRPITDQRQDAAVDAMPETIFVVATPLALPSETSIVLPVMSETPTPTASPTLTPIPSPTRILPEEPTKAPYLFQTPVFIPPNMRDQPIATPTRTRTR